MIRPLEATRTNRFVVAILAGVAAWLICYWHLRILEPNDLGLDFTWPWRAARYLLAGKNPYHEIRPIGVFPFNAYFKYPLPAAIVVIPFAWMSAPAATASFGALSTALLTFGLSSSGFGRLIILLSTPYLTTLLWGQWSTLLMAAALIPPLSWLAVCKPTVGLGTFLYRPNRSAIIGSIAILILSFVLLPTWLSDWIAVLRVGEIGNWYRAPITLVGGQVMLLALLRWRRAEARYLTAISVTPHVLGWYTAFLPMLVAETRREALLLSVSSFVGSYLSGLWNANRQSGELGSALWGYWLLAFVFVPALIIVLRRRNEAGTSKPPVTSVV